MGIPATGRTSTGSGIEVIRLPGGKVVECSALWNDLDRLQKLGGEVVPGAR